MPLTLTGNKAGDHANLREVIQGQSFSLAVQPTVHGQPGSQHNSCSSIPFHRKQPMWSDREADGQAFSLSWRLGWDREMMPENGAALFFARSQVARPNTQSLKF
ncbi:hypothetical protein SAMN05443245_7329 [Paraburkholderia fungorum]|uniref:Uncharacterized protein n=1 Tax=Paraburkholderia fungorum TaxID=134537 RepID=A0A1H1JW18_9BURK|nr:hypothetical protein [Paraburkholderia fungorum]SDR54002.1 hypothetical protein SAMN05443245_7329 [Paraburkholderia fungorum]